MAKIENIHCPICTQPISSSWQNALPPAFAPLEHRDLKGTSVVLVTLGSAPLPGKGTRIYEALTAVEKATNIKLAPYTTTLSKTVTCQHYFFSSTKTYIYVVFQNGKQGMTKMTSSFITMDEPKW